MSIAFSTVERILAEHKLRDFPYHYDEIYLTRLLQFTSDSLLKNLNEIYKQDQLDDKLFLVLVMIEGHHPQGIQPYLLSELTNLSRVQVTRYVDTLVNKNWVERKEHPEDRRSQYLVLTGEGEAFLKKTLPPLQQKITDAWQIISHEEQQQLRTILTKLLNHIESEK